MTLIIAADVQDHLILAGDHCAVLSRVSNRGAPDLVLNNYRKVYPWKYGAVTASGDVFLATLFCRLLLNRASTGVPIDLLKIARQAKAARSREGSSETQSNGNIFFTLPGRDGFDLYSLSVNNDIIEFEIIRPIGAHFSMREGTLDQSAYHALNSRLRPSFFFQNIDAFHRHHIEQLSALYEAQSAVDEYVTSTFDLFILNKQTGQGLYWAAPGAAVTIGESWVEGKDAALLRDPFITPIQCPASCSPK